MLATIYAQRNTCTFVPYSLASNQIGWKKDGKEEKEENENKEREERKEREKKEFITKELHIQSITYQLVHILHKHLLNL